jgi:hypothetical protein
MESALRLGDHQLKVRQFYRVEVVNNENACIQAKIEKFVPSHAASKKWEIVRGINYKRYGTDKFDKAWIGLTKAVVLIPVKDTSTFVLANPDGQE